MKKHNVLYGFAYLSLFLLSFLTLLSFSSVIKINTYLELAVRLFCYLVLIFIPIAARKVEKKEALVYFILIILALYALYETGSFIAVTSTVIGIACRFLDCRKTIIYIFSGAIVGLITHLLITLSCGEILRYLDYRGKHRYLLGFDSPNTIGVYSLWLTLMAYRLGSKRGLLILLFVASLLIYMLTDCRSLLVSGILFIFLSFVLRSDKWAHMVKKMASFAFPAFSILVLVLVNTVNTAPVKEIDELMTHRISWSAMAIEENGYSFLPQSAQYEKSVSKTSSYFTIDVGYVLLMHKYGIIYMAILSIMLAKKAKRANRRGRILIIIFATSLLFETQGLNALIGFPLIDWGDNEA